MAIVNTLPALPRKVLTPFLAYVPYTEEPEPSPMKYYGSEESCPSTLRNTRHHLYHREPERCLSIPSILSIERSFHPLLRNYVRRKDLKTWPLPLRLVQNPVHWGSKSHLLSLEDGSTSSQEKNEALPYTQAVRRKQGPSDKEGNLPLHPARATQIQTPGLSSICLSFWPTP